MHRSNNNADSSQVTTNVGFVDTHCHIDYLMSKMKLGSFQELAQVRVRRVVQFACHGLVIRLVGRVGTPSD